MAVELRNYLMNYWLIGYRYYSDETKRHRKIIRKLKNGNKEQK